MRILIIEDEVKTADYLHQGLTESGYIVDRANDGIDGLHMALQHPYELVILDVNLPGIDGWDLLRRLRERSSARVMMLTGHGRLTDKVRGLDLGADDFMVKPFQFPELLARVRSLLPPRPGTDAGRPAGRRPGAGRQPPQGLPRPGADQPDDRSSPCCTC